jgi:magnesium-transporting ATPase (P-type)
MHPAPEGANQFIYILLVYVHILGALMAIGFNFTYVVWIRRAASDPQTLPFALKGIKFIDDYLANPLYLLAGVTGLAMVLMGKEIRSFLWVAIAIYVVDMVIAYLVYTPMLSRQIKLLSIKGAASPEYQALATRSNIVGALLGVGALVIVALKIFEPSFW